MQLVIEQGSSSGQGFALKKPVMAIGRGAENDLVLSDQGVSRRHARIERGSQGWVLSDLGSTNGTYVNGRSIDGAYLLRAGDRVAIGSAILTIRRDRREDAPGAKEVHRGNRASTARHPVLMVAGAVLLVVALIGIVLLLVTMLQPEPAPPMAEPMGQIEGILTTLPMPAQIQELVPGVVTRIPKDLLELPIGATVTPVPQ